MTAREIEPGIWTDDPWDYCVVVNVKDIRTSDGPYTDAADAFCYLPPFIVEAMRGSLND